MFRNRRRDERGAMLVITCLSMIALLGLAGLVIDGGRMYSDHRQVQNSADAAALAGTGVLNSIINTAGADASIIRTAVQNSITANGTSGTFTCTLVDVNGNALSACPSTTSTLPSGTAGVSVQATDNQNTSFAKVLGINSFSASGTATAQVEALRGGPAPFVVCGYNRGDGNPDLLLSPNWDINPAAIGKTYAIHDPSSVSPCPGGGSGFKGWASPGSFSMPGWWDTQTGDRSGQVPQVLADTNACTDMGSLDGCKVLMPICHTNNGLNGANFKMYCDHFGLFQINDTSSGHSNNSHTATFLGEGIATGGQGGGIPTSYEARIIRLSA